MDMLEHFFAGADINTCILAWVAVETRRAVPLLRAMCSHFKIKIPRAATEPGE